MSAPCNNLIGYFFLQMWQYILTCNLRAGIKYMSTRVWHDRQYILDNIYHSPDFKAIFVVHHKAIWKPPPPLGGRVQSAQSNNKRLTTKRSSQQRFSIKKVFLHFAIFAGKHLCWSLLLTKLQAWRPDDDNNDQDESPTWISNMAKAGFEPLQNLSLGLAE